MKIRMLGALLLVPLAYALLRAAAVARIRRYETLDADSAELPGVRLYLRGRRIHLTVDGQGPPLVLLHGFGSSGAAFRRLMSHLRPSMTVIAPDLPGWGYSERSPDADHTSEAQAALIRELLDRLGIDRTMVVGHGAGAAIAICMAQQSPERIAALVLSRSPGRNLSVHPRLRPLLVLILPLLLETRRGQRLLEHVANGRGYRPDEHLISAHLDEARTAGHAATILAILTSSRRSPSRDLCSFHAPTFMIDGKEPPNMTAAALVDLGRQVRVSPATHVSSN